MWVAVVIGRLFKRGRKASVAVEFALVSTFILAPLLLGSSDLLMIISAQAQLNTALQALYYFAWTNPSSASSLIDAGFICDAINSESVYQITLPATLPSGSSNGAPSYVCVTPGSPPVFVAETGPGSCTSLQIQQTFVTYQVSTTVNLPVQLPGIQSPLTLSATGQIQIQ